MYIEKLPGFAVRERKIVRLPGATGSDPCRGLESVALWESEETIVGVGDENQVPTRNVQGDGKRFWAEPRRWVQILSNH